MRRLHNTSRDYDWGSTDDIPRFLREPADGRPVAEVWMGTHPLGSSTVDTDDGEVSLATLTGELPFMLKLLAASRPLSIQVHPNAQQAKAGFESEEQAGIPIDAPHRVYRDANHKPEMVYALTTFDTLVGFRPTAEILRILSGIESPLAASLAESLNARPGFKGIVRIVATLLEEKPDVAEIDRVVARAAISPLRASTSSAPTRPPSRSRSTIPATSESSSRSCSNASRCSPGRPRSSARAASTPTCAVCAWR